MPVITMRTRRPLTRALGVGAALIASLGTLWLWTLSGGQRPDAPIRAPVAASVSMPGTSSAAADVAPPTIIEPAAMPRPAAPQPVRADPPAPPSAPIPYRFVGRMTVEGEPALVFFGRGRTVTLRGPGPLDDDYAVDAILEQQVLLRHVPSSTSRFVELAARRTDAAVPTSPDSYPQD